MDAGSHGVDLFFVLSAYLITELLAREKHERGSLDVRSFYIRRILRIWPLYYLFIIVLEAALLLSHVRLFPFSCFLTFALLAGNWGTIAFPSKVWIAGPLWSVSIEEQFYLLWPPLVARLSRRHVAFAAVLMIGVANLTRVVMLLAHCRDSHIYFNTFVRLDAIAGGILLAALMHGHVPKLRGGVRFALIAAAVLCILATCYYKVNHENYPTWTEMLGCYPAAAACCAVIVYSVLGMRFESRTLRYLGKISYGLYVFHAGCIALVDKYFKAGPGFIHAPLRIILAFGLTVLVSALSYRFLESPFLKLKKRFTYVDSRPV